MMKPKRVLAGDLIFKTGDAADYMCIISRGEVHITLSNGKQVNQLPEGGYFGETSMLPNARVSRRSADATAAVYTELLTIPAHDFRTLIVEYPKVLQNLQAVADKRKLISAKYGDFRCESSGATKANTKRVVGKISNLMAATGKIDLNQFDGDDEAGSMTSDALRDQMSVHKKANRKVNLDAVLEQMDGLDERERALSAKFDLVLGLLQDPKVLAKAKALKKSESL